MYRKGKQNTPEVICLVSSIRPHTGVIDHTAFVVLRELSDTIQSCSSCVCVGEGGQSFLTIFCSSFNEELIKELNWRGCGIQNFGHHCLQTRSNSLFLSQLNSGSIHSLLVMLLFTIWKTFRREFQDVEKKIMKLKKNNEMAKKKMLMLKSLRERLKGRCLQFRST